MSKPICDPDSHSWRWCELCGTAECSACETAIDAVIKELTDRIAYLEEPSGFDERS